MPYFPKEETEIIKLRKSDVYVLDEQGEIVVENGRPKVRARGAETGQTLEVVRKDAPIEITKIFTAEMDAATNLDRRIKQLTKQLGKENLTDDEYDAIQTRIDALKTRPDRLSAMCSYIASSLKEWDYYHSKADYENGIRVPLEPKAIREQCDPAILGQVVEFLNDRGDQDALEGKELPAVSLNGSSQKEVSANAQTSTQSIS